MDVHEVGDERRHEAAIVERGARDAGRAVVQRAHAVEEVRDETRAGVGRRARLVVRRGRVTDGDTTMPRSVERPRRRQARDPLRARA